MSFRAYDFDIDRARRGIQLFMGTKDFTTFSARNETRQIRYVRSLQSFTLEEAQPLMPFDPLSENFTYWHFICSGRSFLYNQVIYFIYKHILFINTFADKIRML